MLAPAGLGTGLGNVTLGVAGPVGELGVAGASPGFGGIWFTAGVVASGALVCVASLGVAGVLACAKPSDAVINKMVMTWNCLIGTPAAG